VIRNIFFDMGNTLVHRPLDRQVGFAILLRRLGHGVSDEDVLAAYERARKQVPHLQPYRQTAENLNQRLRSKIETTIQILGLPDPRALADRLLESDFNSIQPFEDTIPALEEARSRGFRLGIISNWDPDLADFTRRIGIDGYFDSVIASRALGHRKPNPEIFAAALASMDASARESVHVGDSVGSDAIGAMGMGIQPVVIDREGRHNHLFCPVISSLLDICAAVESL